MDDGSVVNLGLPQDEKLLPESGDQVEFSYETFNETHLFVSAGNLNQTRNNRRSLGIQNVNPAKTPTGSVKIIFFIMDLSPCRTATPATTVNDINNFMYNNQQSVSGMYRACTMGNLQLDPASIVYQIPFPCSGSVGSASFTTNSCYGNNLVNWHLYAANFMSTNFPYVSMSQFHHRVMILPANMASIMAGCGFNALSTQGRWDYNTYPDNNWGAGLVWISGSAATMVPSLFHELGHNYGLQHARSEIPPYVGNTSDLSDTMASWAGNSVRCYNAAHMWTAGWSTPAISLDAARDFVINQAAKVYQLNVQASNLLSPTGMLINMSNIPGLLSVTFAISFRSVSLPYDNPFLELNDGAITSAVFIHRVPSGFSYTDTALVGQLDGLNICWVDPASLLTVRMISLGVSTATIGICRRSQASVDCYNAVSAADAPPKAPSSPSRPSSPRKYLRSPPSPAAPPFTPLQPSNPSAPPPSYWISFVINAPTSANFRKSCAGYMNVVWQLLTSSNYLTGIPAASRSSPADAMTCDASKRKYIMSTTIMTKSETWSQSYAAFFSTNMASIISQTSIPCSSSIQILVSSLSSPYATISCSPAFPSLCCKK